MTNISIKNIFILLGAILGGLVVIWFILSASIFINDAKENRERAERFYKEDVERYEESGRSPFVMQYTYSMTKNLGFYSGGGYISGTDCWERFIKDAWTREEIISTSACDGELAPRFLIRKPDKYSLSGSLTDLRGWLAFFGLTIRKESV